MKYLIFSILAFHLILASCSSESKPSEENTTPVPATKDTLLGPAGADRAKFRIASDVAIYQYPDFTILVEYAEYEDGTTGEAIKLVRKGNPDTTLMSSKSFHFFAGVAGDYLLVDEGTYDLGRTMHILDLKTAQEVGQFNFDDSEMLIENTQIQYFVLLEDEVAAVLSPKPDCPERQEILDAGLGIGYVQQYIFDVATGTSTGTSVFKCKALS